VTEDSVPRIAEQRADRVLANELLGLEPTELLVEGPAEHVTEASAWLISTGIRGGT